MERYDIRVNVWGGVSRPQYEWETVKAEDGDFVLARDAQATVEALQKKYDDLLGKYRQLMDFYDKHNGTPCEQIRHQQQVEALQRVRDEFERERDQLHAALMEAKAALDAEREKVKGLHEITKVICAHCCEPMEIPSKAVLQTQLTQLQALVRVYKEAVDYYAKTAICARAVAALEKAATLDATTPATKGGDGE